MRISDWSSDVCSSDLGRRTFADASGCIVGGTMTGAEIAAEFTAVFTFASAKGHTAQMGAHAHGDQPFLLAFGGTLFERLRITKIAKRHSVGFGDFLGRQDRKSPRLNSSH